MEITKCGKRVLEMYGEISVSVEIRKPVSAGQMEVIQEMEDTFVSQAIEVLRLADE